MEMNVRDELYATCRKDWQSWLEKNHATKREIWLIFYKKHTGKPCISYDDAVEEALCFGWIDSIIKKIDEDKFARKFSPRKLSSRWSERNKERAEQMVREGRMKEAGLIQIRAAQKSGKWFAISPTPKRSETPKFIRDALVKEKNALDNFDKLAESYKRQYIAWITSAKKKETRRKRLTEAIERLKRNEKLGMK